MLQEVNVVNVPRNMYRPQDHSFP